ncbi:MAG TPA: GNAT family N-acetyltransferase [Clostridiaceae bacterium]|nr:GNAT family N-acetyltransferase [Clostridiaceae bacterium]
MMFTTRKATIEDYRDLLEVYTEVDELHRTHHPELFRKPDDGARAWSYIEENLSNDSKALFVAETEGRIIGFAECYIQKSSTFPVIREREWVQLDNIAVLEEYQHLKAGSLLLEEVIGWARNKGIERVELKVYEFNASARDFYVSRGFRNLIQSMYLDL